MEIVNLTFPIQEPIMVFGLTLLIIFFIPLIFTKLRLPGIIGLIISGMLVGSSGFNLLETKGSLELLGNVGLIYLMFLAGLELDVTNFIRNKTQNLSFGGLTFVIPLTIGFAICRYLLNYQTLPALLIASMFATQTLIAYPIVSRLKLTKIRVVEMSIGGTIITDSLVLILFATITSLAIPTRGNHTLLWLFPRILLLTLFIFLVLPRLARWFLKNLSTDQVAQYVFVLSTVFTTSAVAKLLGIEPIIGAFLSGIALNRYIPSSAMLMNRLEFIGNALFIPIFLFYVGMLIDLKAFVGGIESLKLSIILVFIALFTKWLASLITQKIFKLSSLERNLLFGLSTAHAAATVAIILVGYKIGIIDITVLNATIVVIFVSCLVSALVTEKAAKQYAIKYPISSHKPVVADKIIIPIANPQNIERLIELAHHLRESTRKNPITLLRVVKDDDEMTRVNDLANKAEEIEQNFDVSTEWAIRVDVNISSGIVRASKEMLASKIIMGWSGKLITSKKWLFGSILEGVLTEARQPVYVCSLKGNLDAINELYFIIPRNAEFDPDFKNCMHSFERIVRKSKQNVTLIVDKVHAENITAELPQSYSKIRFNFRFFKTWASAFDMVKEVNHNALIIILSARKGTISHSGELDNTLLYTGQVISQKNFIIYYPAMPGSTLLDSRFLLAGTGRIVTDN